MLFNAIFERQISVFRLCLSYKVNRLEIVSQTVNKMRTNINRTLTTLNITQQPFANIHTTDMTVTVVNSSITFVLNTTEEKYINVTSITSNPPTVSNFGSVVGFSLLCVFIVLTSVFLTCKKKDPEDVGMPLSDPIPVGERKTDATMYQAILELRQRSQTDGIHTQLSQSREDMMIHKKDSLAELALKKIDSEKTMVLHNTLDGRYSMMIFQPSLSITKGRYGKSRPRAMSAGTKIATLEPSQTNTLDALSSQSYMNQLVTPEAPDLNEVRVDVHTQPPIDTSQIGVLHETRQIGSLTRQSSFKTQPKAGSRQSTTKTLKQSPQETRKTSAVPSQKSLQATSTSLPQSYSSGSSRDRSTHPLTDENISDLGTLV